MCVRVHLLNSYSGTHLCVLQVLVERPVAATEFPDVSADRQCRDAETRCKGRGSAVSQALGTLTEMLSVKIK